MDLDSPGILKDQEHDKLLVIDPNVSSTPSTSQSRSNSVPPSSTTPSNGSTWSAIHRLELGATPKKVKRNEWMCSKECKKKNQTVLYKDSQAVEKHILRNHPDPIYNEFVCLFAWCKMKKTSPQQILDHLSQAEKSGGHEVKNQFVKYESIRAVHKDTKDKFRVRRDKKEFAWYICIPPAPSTKDSGSSTPVETVSNSQDNQINNQSSSSQVESSTGRQAKLVGNQTKANGKPQNDKSDRKDGKAKSTSHRQTSPPFPGRPHGRPPDDNTGRPFDPDITLTDSFSAIPG